MRGLSHLMNRRMFTYIFIVILLVSLTACYSGSAGDLDQDQSLNLTIPYMIKRFDTAVANDSFSMNILSNVGEGLMRLDENHKPIPGVAKKVDISPDQMVYTFHLRQAEWSDGEPVTAKDFEFAWKRALAPETKSPNAYLFYSIVNADKYHEGEVEANKVGIQAIDEKTLQVRLKRPDRSFLRLVTLTAYLPQREEIVKANTPLFGTKPKNMVFNGPFQIRQISEEGTVTLSKNLRYWDQQNVRLQSVYFFVSNNSVRNLNYYNAGKIDVTPIKQEFAKAYLNSNHFHSVQTSTTQYIRFNYKNRFLQNKKIRQAINYAIDRETLVKNVKNGAEPATGLIPPTIAGVQAPFRQESKIPPTKQNIQKAKQLFQEGLAEMGLTQPPVGLIMLSYEDERKQLAIEIKNQLQQTLGLTVLLNTTSRSEKLYLEEAGQFDLALSDWAATYPDAATFLETFTSNHPTNTGKYSDSPFDKTILRALTSSSTEQQIKYLIQAENFLVNEDQALIPLYYVNDVYLVKPYVKGLVRHPFGAPYSLKEVYITEKED